MVVRLKNRYYLVFVLLLLVGIVAGYFVGVYAAVPGVTHGADEVTPGTFGGSSPYSFPFGVKVTNGGLCVASSPSASCALSPGVITADLLWANNAVVQGTSPGVGGEVIVDQVSAKNVAVQPGNVKIGSGTLLLNNVNISMVYRATSQTCTTQCASAFTISGTGICLAAWSGTLVAPQASSCGVSSSSASVFGWCLCAGIYI